MARTCTSLDVRWSNAVEGPQNATTPPDYRPKTSDSEGCEADLGRTTHALNPLKTGTWERSASTDLSPKAQGGV
jgi:hypothetical protein